MSHKLNNKNTLISKKKRSSCRQQTLQFPFQFSLFLFSLYLLSLLSLSQFSHFSHLLSSLSQFSLSLLLFFFFDLRNASISIKDTRPD